MESQLVKCFVEVEYQPEDDLDSPHEYYFRVIFVEVAAYLPSEEAQAEAQKIVHEMFHAFSRNDGSLTVETAAPFRLEN